MMNLHRPLRTIEQLQRIAASGASGLARQAQAELTARMTESLKRAVQG